MNSLERLAIDAHHRGETWDEWWAQYGAQVKQAEPYNRLKLRRLVRRLSYLLTCGNTDGQFPPGDEDGIMPWDRDDLAEQDRIDGETHARIQLPLPLTYPEVTT